MMIGIALASALAMQTAPDCRQADEAMLALPLHDFDQTAAGWRSIDAQACEAVAADAIVAYRQRNAEALKGEDTGTLDWHEGQLRAAAGQTDRAIAIFEAGLDDADEVIRPYRAGTIAFLKQDRPALETAYRDLMRVPAPPYFAQAKARYEANYPNLPPLTWPLNRDKLEGFLACFDRPYSEAYGCDSAGKLP